MSAQLSLDYNTNVYLAVSIQPMSQYTTTPISLASYPSVSDIGTVGQLTDVKLLSVPKDEWENVGTNILEILKQDTQNVLRVDVQMPKTRTKRGTDEL